MKSRELNATIMTSRSTRSSSSTAIPARADGASVSQGLLGSRRTVELRGGDRDERKGQRVDRHRQPEAAGGERDASDQRPEAEADVAGGLDVAVGLLRRLRPASTGTSANSAGWETAKIAPSSTVSPSRTASSARRQHRRLWRPPSRPPRPPPAAASSPSGPPAAPRARRGPPRARRGNPQRRDLEPGAGHLLDLEAEGDDGDPVAEGRQADRAGDQAKVTIPAAIWHPCPWCNGAARAAHRM